MTLLMKILQGLMLKHVYILLILNFPLKMEAATFPLSGHKSIYSDLHQNNNIIFGIPS